MTTLPKIVPPTRATGPDSSASGWTAVPTAPERRVEIGFQSLAERRRVLDWLNEGLRPGRPGRLASEYPLLFERNASAIHITVWDRSTPVAFCTLWAVTYRVGVHRLRCGMVSLVYTDPAERGRGLARQVVSKAVEHARELELGLVLLWSDLDRLYRPMGFHRTGRESLLVLEPETLESAIRESSQPTDLRIEAAQPVDWIELERLRGYRTSQLELDPGDISRARTIPDLSVRVARNADGIQAFAIRGRGDDLAEVIHEWGGDPDAAMLCARGLMEDAAPWNELFLMVPAGRDELAWRLRRAGAHAVQQPMAWMRVASPGALAADISRMLPEGEGLEIDCIENPASEESPHLRLRSPFGEAVVESAHWLEALFGSATRRDRSAIVRRIEPAIGEKNCQELPIPFFVWGLESI